MNVISAGKKTKLDLAGNKILMDLPTELFDLNSGHLATYYTNLS